MKSKGITILALILLVSMLAACGTTTTPASSAAPSSAAPAVTSAAQATDSAAPADPGETREKAVSNGKEFYLTGYPIVDEKMTLSVLMRQLEDMADDANTNPLTQDIEQLSNIHIDWVQIPSVGFADRRALMLATGDLPDIFGGQGPNDTELVRYGAEGVFADLDELMYLMPNTKAVIERRDWVSPLLRTPDGKLYVTPRVDDGPWIRGNIQIINKDKLSAAGLQMPTNVNEFADALRTMKAAEPDLIGYSWFCGNSGGSYGDGSALRQLMHPFGLAANSRHMDVVDGNIRFIPYGQQEEFQNAMDYLHMLFSEGLINTNGFTDEYAQHGANLNAIPNKVGAAVVWDILDDIGVTEAAAQFDYMPPLLGPNNEPPRYYFPRFNAQRTGFLITETCQYPEIAARWIDIAYDIEWSVQYKEGRFNDRLEFLDKEGYWVVKTPPEGVNAQQWRRQTSLLELGWAVWSEETYTFFVLPYVIPKVEMQDKYFEQYATGPRDIWANTTLTIEEAERISVLQPALESLTNRKVGEWVMGGTHRAEWASYIAELESIGIQEYIQIRQQAYDRFAQHLPN